MRAVGFQGNRPRIALVSEAQHGPGDAHGLVAKRTPFALEQYVLLSPEEQEQLNVSDVPMQGRPKCPARGLLDEEALLALPVGSKQTDALSVCAQEDPMRQWFGTSSGEKAQECRCGQTHGAPAGYSSHADTHGSDVSSKLGVPGMEHGLQRAVCTRGAVFHAESLASRTAPELATTGTRADARPLWR